MSYTIDTAGNLYVSGAYQNMVVAAPNGITNTYNGAAIDVLDITGGIETRLAAIEQQLMILTRDLSLEAAYPALKEAYDAYQLVLAMVKENKK